MRLDFMLIMCASTLEDFVQYYSLGSFVLSECLEYKIKGQHQKVIKWQFCVYIEFNVEIWT